jgi:drug/metabolite transporter (DMT)-like permease
MQAVWMIVASILFAGMGVCVKYAAEGFSASEIILCRGLLTALFIGMYARIRGASLRTACLGMHAWRSLIGGVALGAWFYAITELPLGTAMSLNYMSSIWVAVFLVGGALLAWRPGTERPPILSNPAMPLTLIAGFLGVLLVLKPTFNAEQLFAGVIGLLSGVAAALAYMQLVALSRHGESDTRCVFYFALGSIAVGAIGAAMAPAASDWSARAATWLVPVAVLATAGQLCMTRAYATARTDSGTLWVSNLQYSGILFAALLGYLLFGEQLGVLTLAGMILIVSSGVAATVIQHRTALNAPRRNP